MSAIQKMLLKNIDQDIELILIKQKQYDLYSFVRGYHAYIDRWTPKAGDFCLKSENQNQHDKFAVAIVLEERIVGHVLKNLSKLFH